MNNISDKCGKMNCEHYCNNTYSKCVLFANRKECSKSMNQRKRNSKKRSIADKLNKYGY